jgi:TonB family protein
LTALPSRHGFSNPAWQHTAAAKQRIIEPVREQAFLDTSSETEIPVLLDEESVTDTIQIAATKLPAETDRPEVDLDAPIPILNQSVLNFEGALSHRPLARQAALPVVTSDTPLRPTRVRLAVAPDGTVRYFTLDRSSGNEGVDAQALEFIRQLRFEPEASPDPLALTWGAARFFWATNPPESK